MRAGTCFAISISAAAHAHRSGRPVLMGFNPLGQSRPPAPSDFFNEGWMPMHVARCQPHIIAVTNAPWISRGDCRYSPSRCGGK
jgi:hypothetical protein